MKLLDIQGVISSTRKMGGGGVHDRRGAQRRQQRSSSATFVAARRPALERIVKLIETSRGFTSTKSCRKRQQKLLPWTFAAATLLPWRASPGSDAGGGALLATEGEFSAAADGGAVAWRGSCTTKRQSSRRGAREKSAGVPAAVCVVRLRGLQPGGSLVGGAGAAARRG